MKRLALLALLLASPPVVAAPAPFPKSGRPDLVRQELRRLRGTWEAEAAYARRGGGWRQINLLFPFSAVIEGDRVEWRHGAYRSSPMRFSLALGEPRGLDLAGAEREGLERSVYRLDGDTLVLVSAKRGETRPVSLDGGASKLVFRRKR